MRVSRFGLLGLVGLVMLGWTGSAPAGENSQGLAIFDAKADAGTDIAAALERAQQRGTRVLLKFGANWCSWCHKLHDLFSTDEKIRTLLRDEYELVLVNVDQGRHADIVEKYGNPTKQGLPVLVVLDASGKHLHTQETGSLEKGDAHDPAKIRAFLETHRAPQQDAAAAVAEALTEAKRGNRKVFLYFTAPWCAWCHRLDAYLRTPEVAAIFAKAFTVARVDTVRMAQGSEVAERYQAADRGLPYFLVLDAEGAKLADSQGNRGNVGFPVEPHEIEHFLRVIREQVTSLTSDEMKTLERALRAAAPQPSDSDH